MGSCFDTPTEDMPTKISKLTRLRSQMMSSIELNKIKIEKLEKELQNYNEQIKQEENDLRQNQYSYSDAEKKAKAKKILELQKDRQRAEKQSRTLTAYNDQLKNNLSAIESKIEELKNNQQIVAGNDIMAQVGDIDTGEALQKNIENMMRQQQKEEENLRIMENGNRAINDGLGLNNEDDVLKAILGNGTSGAPPAY